jgi:hypothetical protein
MKRICAGFAMAAFGGWAFVATAHAAPPTATPSPGYDARLQEQRAARPPVFVPKVRPQEAVFRWRDKRVHGAR